MMIIIKKIIIIIIMLIIKLIHFLEEVGFHTSQINQPPSDDHLPDCHFIQIAGNLKNIMKIMTFEHQL